MTTTPTAEEGASEELTDAYGTVYLRDAGTGQLHRVGSKAIKRPVLLFDVEQAAKNIDAVLDLSQNIEPAAEAKNESNQKTDSRSDS